MDRNINIDTHLVNNITYSMKNEQVNAINTVSHRSATSNNIHTDTNTHTKTKNNIHVNNDVKPG